MITARMTPTTRPSCLLRAVQPNTRGKRQRPPRVAAADLVLRTVGARDRAADRRHDFQALHFRSGRLRGQSRSKRLHRALPPLSGRLKPSVVFFTSRNPFYSGCDILKQNQSNGHRILLEKGALREVRVPCLGEFPERVDAPRSDARAGRSANGATSPLPRVPPKVPSPFDSSLIANSTALVASPDRG